MDVYIFPYEIINKGAKVIIYGAGNVGRRYVEQILENDYCNLIGVADKQAGTLCSNVVNIIHPDDLKNYDYDNLIIAIKDSDIAGKIREDLIKKYAVPKEKIIWKKSMKYLPAPSKKIWCVLPDAPKFDDEILISAFIGEGFGDAIISKKIIETLGKMAGPKCRIDIYSHDNTYNFVCGLYGDSSFVKNIYRGSVYNFSRYFQSYDLSITPLYILAIDHLDFESLARKNKSFAERLAALKKYLDNSGLDIRHHLDNSILYARTKKMGCNAYTVHSYGGILPIEDTKVNIPLLPEFEDEYSDIFTQDNEFTFITLNYGWGMDNHNSDYVPCKMWPFEFYEKLVAFIKNKYQSIKLVQIAKGDAPRISGTDMVLRNMDLEVVKYVLRDSLLHIDSEGGMVHLATQLGTKCLVAFGPTPVHFFGYESNINVVSEKCSNCYLLHEDFASCFRGMREPECMYSITPEMMFKKFDEYMINR